jgi:hypothetical protein
MVTITADLLDEMLRSRMASSGESEADAVRCILAQVASLPDVCFHDCESRWEQSGRSRDSSVGFVPSHAGENTVTRRTEK